MKIGRLWISPPHRGTWKNGVCIDWRRRPRPGDPTWTSLDGVTGYVPLYRFVRIYVQW